MPSICVRITAAGCLVCLLCGCAAQVMRTPLANAAGAPTASIQLNPTAPEPTAAAPLSGPYLGQTPPGSQPVLFAPGVVSVEGSLEYSGSFSPDGTEYYFYRIEPGRDAVLLFSQMSGETWSAPQALLVSAGYAAYEPHVTLDGRWLYFGWEHPVPEGKPAFPALFVAARTAGGWSDPVYAGQGMFVSSSLDGQVYTTDMSTRQKNGKTYLASVTTEDGIFTGMQRLPTAPYAGQQAHPCIAPDGSYILFDVDSGSHLFISFRRADGTWSEGIDLAEHGFDPQAGGATLSPDGKYLFFAQDQDIWWVDAGVLQELRPAE